MEKSPGHRKWPDHKVQEERIDRPVRIAVQGQVVAESDDVIRVDEDEHPPRYYFPRSALGEDRLESSGRDTECPFKGHGRYFNLRGSDGAVENAAWSYEDPYEEHAGLKDRIAFHDAEMDEIEVQV